MKKNKRYRCGLCYRQKPFSELRKGDWFLWQCRDKADCCRAFHIRVERIKKSCGCII